MLKKILKTRTYLRKNNKTLIRNKKIDKIKILAFLIFQINQLKKLVSNQTY